MLFFLSYHVDLTFPIFVDTKLPITQGFDSRHTVSRCQPRPQWLPQRQVRWETCRVRRRPARTTHRRHRRLRYPLHRSGEISVSGGVQPTDNGNFVATVNFETNASGLEAHVGFSRCAVAKPSRPTAKDPTPRHFFAVNVRWFAIIRLIRSLSINYYRYFLAISK